MFNDQTSYCHGVSFVDFDQDGWDDLTFGELNSIPTFYRNTGSEFEFVSLDLPPLNEGNMKMILWVDYDQDKDLDLFITYYYQPSQLLRNDGDLVFTDVTTEAGIYEEITTTIGSCWGDIDNDGFLDLYVSKFGAEPGANDTIANNHLYHNQGDGSFEMISFPAGVGNGVQPTFQSLFMDYNSDGLQDIYLINDRITNENALYENNGDLTFTDVSATTGSNIAIDAMTGTLGDFDGDLDLDIYMTNTIYGNVLLRQEDDDTFTDISEEAAVETFKVGWGSVFMDYENDGDQDLYVMSTGIGGDWTIQNNLYAFEEELPFTDVTAEANLSDDEFRSFVVACGDINNDGYPDFAQGNMSPSWSQVFQNQGGENHWLKVGLEGVFTNSKGIGARILIYTQDGPQLRYVNCGENFLGQDSYTEMFGLGETPQIDSLQVQWLGGWIDTFYDVPCDTTLNIVEGSSLTVDIIQTGTLCPESQVTLAVDDYATVMWSTGEDESTISVTEPGEYWVEVTHEAGYVLSDTLELEIISGGDYLVVGTDPLCHGAADGEIAVINEGIIPISELLVDGEPVESPFMGLSEGNYEILILDSLGCQFLENVELTAPDSLEMELFTQDISCYGLEDGIIEGTITGGTSPYDAIGIGENLSPGMHNVHVTDAKGCEAEMTIELFEPDPISVEFEIEALEFGLFNLNTTVSGGTPPYNYEWMGLTETGESLININEGSYSVIITDQNSCTETFGTLVSSIDDEHEAFFEVFVSQQGQLTVSSDEPLQKISLFESTGRLLHVEKGEGISQSVNLDLPTGIYIIAVQGINSYLAVPIIIH